MIKTERQLAIKQRDLSKWQQMKKRTMEMARKFELEDADLLAVIESRIAELSQQCQEFQGMKVGGWLRPKSDRSREIFDAVKNCANFGQLLIEARIELGWSQADLADAVGLERQHIWRYENSIYRNINLAAAARIAEALYKGLSLKDSLLERGLDA